MTTMHNMELNDMELNLVSGGADGDNEFSIAKLLEEYDFDPTKDPFYFPDHKLPWEDEKLDLKNITLILAPDLIKVA